MRRAVGKATRRLAARFRGVCSEETVACAVVDSYEQLGDRPTVGLNFMPIFAGERYEDVAHPAGQPLEVVRRIGYEIHQHVAELLETLPGVVPQ